MRNGLRFLLRASAFALALFAVYQWVRPYYWELLFDVGNMIFSNGREFTLYYDSLDKIIPFVALLLATPKMPLLRKTGMLALGLSVFIAVDVGCFYFSAPLDYQQTGSYNSPPSETYFWIWETYGRWLLPLILWVLASYRYLDELFKIDFSHKAISN